MFQRVHYTWIGPPKFNGQTKPDVLGPNSLRRAQVVQDGQNVAIHFWCLAEYADEYERYFRGGAGRPVSVLAIERYLEQQLGVRGGARRRLGQSLINSVWYLMSWNVDLVVQHIVEQSVRSGTTVREIVTAKEVWSMYILSKLGGYAMDTGVGAWQDTIRLVGYDRLMAPAQGENLMGLHVRAGRHPMNKYCSTVTMTTGEHLLGHDADYTLAAFPRVDVWTLYSPAGGGGITYTLNWYIRYWYLLEEVRKEALKPNAHRGVDYYKDLCRHGVVGAVSSGLTHAAVNNGLCPRQANKGSVGRSLWNGDLEEDQRGFTGIKELGLQKHYFGSHH